MFSINLQCPLVTLAVMAGLLAVAGPASASSIDLNGAGGNASNASGAVVAADFNYDERATGSTAPLGSTKGSFIGGHRVRQAAA